MKKLLLCIMVLVLFTMSCRKTPVFESGSWSFKNVTYSNQYTELDSLSNPPYVRTSVSSTQNLNSGGALTINFYGTFPPTQGIYTVDNTNTPHAGHVTVDMLIGGTTIGYQSTGGNGNEQIQVAISNNNMTITGSGIEMLNSNDPTDSSALSMNFTHLLKYF